MKKLLTVLLLPLALTACGPDDSFLTYANPTATPTVIVAKFNIPTPTTVTSVDVTPVLSETNTPAPTTTVLPSLTSTLVPTDTATVTATLEVESTSSPEPSPTPTSKPVTAPAPADVAASLAPPADTPAPEPPPAANVDFAMRYVRLRTNAENSWDGVLGEGQCGSDHSIYVHVADAQENLLDGVLIGDKYGNFEVPTGIDGPGVVRILVWSATMELSVVGHQDGTRYASQFTPPLSTLDEDIPLDWLEQAGYCESPEDCRWRVDNNQICRGHYSYDVIFQRTW